MVIIGESISYINPFFEGDDECSNNNKSDLKIPFDHIAKQLHRHLSCLLSSMAY